MENPRGFTGQRHRLLSKLNKLPGSAASQRDGQNKMFSHRQIQGQGDREGGRDPSMLAPTIPAQVTGLNPIHDKRYSNER